jgi:nucleotide-binding universal stress UspA family protein
MAGLVTAPDAPAPDARRSRPPAAPIAGLENRRATGPVICAVEAAALARALRSPLVLVDASARLRAELERAELLVVAAPPRAQLGPALLGRRFGELVRRSPCPVVVVPPRAEPGLHSRRAAESLVFGVGGTEASRVAMQVAADLAARLRLRPIAVRAHESSSGVSLEPLSGRAGGTAWPRARAPSPCGTARSGRPSRQAARRGPVRGRGEARGSERDREPLDLKVSLVVDEGEPVDVLAGAGRERAATLIVTGTRGRSVLSSALLGSVSVGVVRTADRRVALVPASAGDAPEIGYSHQPGRRAGPA